MAAPTFALSWLVSMLLCLATSPAAARDANAPIELAWSEGDLAGLQMIYPKEGNEPIGYVEYTQRRRGDTLEAKRVSYFHDGSSDEDSAVARIGKTLRTVR